MVQQGMMVTFGFHPDRKQALQDFIHPSGPNCAPYIALLEELGITQQSWYYFTPNASAPPQLGHKLVIVFLPDDATIWFNFIRKAKDQAAHQVVKNAFKTLPVGTSTGPDFRAVWPDETLYDREVLFTYP